MFMESEDITLCVCVCVCACVRVCVASFKVKVIGFLVLKKEIRLYVCMLIQFSMYTYFNLTVYFFFYIKVQLILALKD